MGETRVDQVLARVTSSGPETKSLWTNEMTAELKLRYPTEGSYDLSRQWVDLWDRGAARKAIDRQARLLGLLNVSSNGHQDERWSWSSVNQELQRVLIALALTERPWPLYLFGPIGAGKTCAARAFCTIIDRAMYWGLPDFLRLAYEASHGFRESSVWTSVVDASVAILDEIGLRDKDSADISAAHSDRVYEFCDKRERLPAIYVSNLDDAKLEKLYGPRIADRMLRGTVFQLNCKSRRTGY